jgi:hypothetical protein
VVIGNNQENGGERILEELEVKQLQNQGVEMIINLTVFVFMIHLWCFESVLVFSDACLF